VDESWFCITPILSKWNRVFLFLGCGSAALGIPGDKADWT
jgi:hypothetical protein